MRALINSLPTTDQDLLRETQSTRMNKLDEDSLLDLHERIRRARNKNVKIYRRQAAASVETHSARGVAHPKNTRARDRAEVYEDALARVSARVEVLARKAAEKLKTERLAAAQAATSAGPTAATKAPVKPARARKRAAMTRKTAAKKAPIARKQVAAMRAAGARRQAKRDAR